MERLVGQTLNRYKLTQLLGEGGMGAVFKATDVTLQRDVAIKIMHPHMARRPNFRERFLQEARTAARLDHPSIVQVYDFGQEQSLLYIVMEFIPGANLRHMLEDLKAQNKWIPLDESVQMIHHIALAMHYAHQHGVLHRDLKPSNVMIEPEPAGGLPYRPVLTDLGLARLLEGDRITQAGTSMGTPTYMSPEQAMGEDTDARSDVYSLGVILYELAVGRPPFPIKTMSEAIRYHTKETPQPPSEVRPDLPQRLEWIIMKALEKDPNDRIQNAEALAQALSALATEVTEIASAPTAVESSVSLMTQYQKSVAEPRGPSVLQEFGTPAGSGDVIQAQLPNGSTIEATMSGPSLTIGRAEDNELTLNSTNVSRHHARIEFDGQDYRVIDLDSTNGTHLANAKLLPGVPEIWLPDQPLRIGDVWLRLVIGDEHAATSLLGADGTAASATHVDPSMVRSSVGEGRVGVVMEESQLTITPGERKPTSVVLLNQGSIVDHFRVTVEGIPADWVDLPPVVQLMPGQQQEVTITLHPPRDPEARAGRYTLTIRVISRDAPSQFVDVRRTLTLGTFSQFTSSLQPQKIRAGQPTHVTIQNQGNYPESYTLIPSDRGNELTFEPATTQIKVPQGQSTSAELRAEPKKRPLIGGTKSHPFVVSVRPPEGDPRQHAGELVSRARIPAWVPPLVLTLLLIACGVLALVLTRPPVIELVAIAPTNPVAGEPVTIRWRVSNAQRVELRPFDIEVDPDVGEYTFEEGFQDPTNVKLVAANTFRTAEESLNIQVNVPVVEPVINEWSVFPTEITQGQEVTIRWSVSNAEDVRVQPFGTVDSSGERKDTPQQTETYTLVASNQGQSVEQSQRVVVATPAPDAPKINAFSVSPATIIEGETTDIQISWETADADTVTIEPGLGPVGLTGSRDVPAPTSDTVYTLVAKGPGGEAQAQAQVMVEVQRCFVSVDDLKLREGPGTAYDPPIGSLSAGTQVKPLAYSDTGYPDGQWVQVQVVGTGEEGWVSQSFLADCNVDVTTLGTAPFPPTPAPPFTVTNIDISVTPTTFTGDCPQQFDVTAQVTVNGAGTVTYTWERSDGADAPEENLDFDSAGTKSINTSWTLSANGDHWMRLHVLSPDDMFSDQAGFTLQCQTSAVYIYSANASPYQAYIDLLEDNNFEVDLIDMSAILSTNFDDYDLVLVGPDTGSGGSWGDNAGNQAGAIESSGTPVVGIGEGGYAFFGKLEYAIGWGNGWHGSGNNVYVVDPEHEVWNSPNEISIPGNRRLQVYASDSAYIGIHLPGPISGITAIGRQVGDDTHYHIIDKDNVYVLWGWNSGPSEMTPVGQQLFINTARSVLGLRLILPVPTLILQP